VSVPGNPAEKRFSLSRWSARKRNARRGRANVAGDDTRLRQDGVAADRVPAQAPAGAVLPEAGDAPVAVPLPDVDALTFDSDFSAFMANGVDADVRRAAVRKLLRDPRFNVMDGLDVYIDDYTKPDPIPPSMLAQLQHAVATLAPTAAPASDVPDAGSAESPVEIADAGDDAALASPVSLEAPIPLPASVAEIDPDAIGADGAVQPAISREHLAPSQKT